MKSSERSFPTRLRRARREMGLSQQELAEMMMVHRNTIVRWESRLSDPSPVQVESLAELLGKELSYFQEQPQDEPVAAEEQQVLDPWMQQVSLERLQELTPEALRRLRREKGLSITDIAHKVRVPNAIVRDWIAQRRVPSVGDLSRLRESFGDDFDPTPMLARRAPVKSSEDMLLLLINKVERLEAVIVNLQEGLKQKGLL